MRLPNFALVTCRAASLTVPGCYRHLDAAVDVVLELRDRGVVAHGVCMAICTPNSPLDVQEVLPRHVANGVTAAAVQSRVIGPLRGSVVAPAIAMAVEPTAGAVNVHPLMGLIGLAEGDLGDSSSIDVTSREHVGGCEVTGFAGEALMHRGVLDVCGVCSDVQAGRCRLTADSKRRRSCLVVGAAVAESAVGGPVWRRGAVAGVARDTRESSVECGSVAGGAGARAVVVEARPMLVRSRPIGGMSARHFDDAVDVEAGVVEGVVGSDHRPMTGLAVGVGRVIALWGQAVTRTASGLGAIDRGPHGSAVRPTRQQRRPMAIDRVAASSIEAGHRAVRTGDGPKVQLRGPVRVDVSCIEEVLGDQMAVFADHLAMPIGGSQVTSMRPDSHR